MRPGLTLARACLLLLLCALLTTACSNRESAARLPIATRSLLLDEPAPHPRALIVFLPGVDDRAEDFDRHGFLLLAGRFGLRADVVMADAHLAYYTERTLVRRLEQDVIGPARAAGYRHIWLVGISMGGLGSLLYAREHPEQVDGIVALAPFLGREDWLEAADGRGSPGEQLGYGFEPGLWRWLQGYARGAPRQPRLILAYGTEDRYALGHRLLGELLPARQIIRRPGKHRWPTWIRLWEAVLARPDFLPQARQRPPARLGRPGTPEPAQKAKDSPT
ncbi:alpha/beta fold hydrolase [Alkalilimnicola sp. S0819]|uniref:alpha/beta fold hydrolase n=1 Tax=Alkalilimnicola sp. S0819 TaxID=2613922 RepID=UPI001261994D|nr:alpha/beta fold hydrolase [Alkalilimnicola sp. S0819]KAB7624187.1 alpha/beta fold hydrolase [Alkalilimnicola sp. S0819]MPQ16442.1 alpha/beta fold hydrolase [Alkalilimnicola sp. S0819]